MGRREGLQGTRGQLEDNEKRRHSYRAPPPPKRPQGSVGLHTTIETHIGMRHAYTHDSKKAPRQCQPSSHVTNKQMNKKLLDVLRSSGPIPRNPLRQPSPRLRRRLPPMEPLRRSCTREKRLRRRGVARAARSRGRCCRRRRRSCLFLRSWCPPWCCSRWCRSRESPSCPRGRTPGGCVVARRRRKHTRGGL